MDKSRAKRKQRNKQPQYMQRMGKEKLRLADHPLVSPQMKALARLRYVEACKRLAVATTTEEK